MNNHTVFLLLGIVTLLGGCEIFDNEVANPDYSGTYSCGNLDIQSGFANRRIE